MDMPKSTSRTGTIMAVGLVILLLLGTAIAFLCYYRVQYSTQTLLQKQHNIEQAWLNNAMEEINAWRNEMLSQARFVSSSEMFRLFITDFQELGENQRKLVHEPDSLYSHNETIRSMAEQMTYLQDLLKDFTKRRAWTDARVLLPDATQLIAPDFSLPLTDIQKALVEKAAESGKSLFGPIHTHEGVLVINLAEPFFEVLGTDEPKPVGILLLTLPMERPITTFLTSKSEYSKGMRARIVEKTAEGATAILMDSGVVVQEKTPAMPPDEFPFMLRDSVDGHGQVYSLGAKPAGLDWMYVLGLPASIVEKEIHEQTLQIYGGGAAATCACAILGMLIWSMMTSKQHKEHVKYLTELNRKNEQQKIMLQSINASLDAGLILVDDHDNILVSNPNFQEIIGRTEEIPEHAPLSEIVPDELLVPLQEKMRSMERSDKAGYMEARIKPENGGEERLYRISLYPYIDSYGSPDFAHTGCVAIFQDITVFRQQALIRQEREAAMLSALGRAIESVDPNMVGHSDKMAAVAKLLAEKLNMTPEEKETLNISSRLSQVGKIFVPRDLLTRHDLSPEELAEVKRAPEYADRILHDLHFDLPIQQTVRQMGEKMDGSGPLGMKAEELTAAGCALAVINAFIAMTSPRAWRKDKQIDPEEAIKLLAQNAAFNQDTVAALAEIPKADLLKAINKN